MTTELRPFDLEAAKRGEEICWSHISDLIRFAGTMHADKDPNKLIVSTPEHTCYSVPPSCLRMKPLFYIKETPIYKNDVVWTVKGSIVVKSAESDTTNGLCVLSINTIDGQKKFRASDVYLEKPKVIKEAWVNIYPHGRAVYHSTQRDAEESATREDGNIDPSLLASILISWEE